MTGKQHEGVGGAEREAKVQRGRSSRLNPHHQHIYVAHMLASEASGETVSWLVRSLG